MIIVKRTEKASGRHWSAGEMDDVVTRRWGRIQSNNDVSLFSVKMTQGCCVSWVV